MSNFEDVGAFHEKFDLPVSGSGYRELSEDVLVFRFEFLVEELRELSRAIMDKNHVEIADALVDLVYVAMGTAHLLGIPWEDVWDEVQRANMTKERALPDASNSKRGHSWDVIKPPGWTGPRVAEVLKRHGFPA